MAARKRSLAEPPKRVLGTDGLLQGEPRPGELPLGVPRPADASASDRDSGEGRDSSDFLLEEGDL